MPAGVTIMGRSAAHLWGAELAAASDPVEVLSPVRFGSLPGLVVRSGHLAADEMTRCDGIPVCTPAHAIWQIAKTRKLIHAIGWVDAVARCRRLTPHEVAAHAERHRGEHGSRQAMSTMRLCDPRAESVPESKVRVSLVCGGFPLPVPQFRVTATDGSFIARVDLAWPQWKFAIEYDGQEFHGQSIHLDHDRSRTRALNNAGWRVYPVTKSDLHDIPALLADIARELAKVNT